MKPKIAKCKVCGEKFQLFNSLRPYCSPICGAKYAVRLQDNKKAKESRDKTKEMKIKLLTKSDYLKMLQIVFNAFIRERDKNDPCISCGTMANVKYDAGHYYHSNYSFLRFHENNVHKQCSNNCNVKLSGNLAEYLPRLINKIGATSFKYLEESRHKKLELSVPEILEEIKRYKQKTKELKLQKTY